MPKKTYNKSVNFPKNGVYFHASSVNISGKALVFLGHSHSGKSTISRLLSERFPVIADDKVFIYWGKNVGWVVHNASDNYYVGTGTVYSIGQKRYPLLALLRIFKAKTAHIVPISSKQTCKYLMDAIFENDFHRNIEDIETRKNWFKLNARISKEVEGWHLTFPKNKSILKKINDTFSAMAQKNCHYGRKADSSRRQQWEK